MLAEIPVSIQVLLAPGVIVGWFAIIGLLSWLGGWSRLARVYRDEMSESTDGHTWRMQSVSLRGWCGYNNCVSIEATAKGLKISPWFIMRPGHPPLFLPFDEMTSSSRTMLGVGLEQVRMTQDPAISIDFRRTLVDSVREELGDVWPEDSAGQSDAETGA
ncbi:MAG TPA: hypothetical protein DCE47_10050 [Planctomycetaceae bacterium]|nr:hypothetical protein [Planctomycetaceae bacterium]HCD02112.1 hypothetical protein [Planctomycetaceae bacterium]